MAPLARRVVAARSGSAARHGATGAAGGSVNAARGVTGAGGATMTGGGTGTMIGGMTGVAGVGVTRPGSRSAGSSSSFSRRVCWCVAAAVACADVQQERGWSQLVEQGLLVC